MRTPLGDGLDILATQRGDVSDNPRGIERRQGANKPLANMSLAMARKLASRDGQLDGMQ
jgi:hypothetical protein